MTDNIFVQKDNSCDADDLFTKAKAYQFGTGVEKDEKKAAELYQAAMEQGNMSAKHNLALMHLFSTYEQANQEKGFLMMKELADEGDPEAICNIASCYMEGRACDKNIEKGLALYQSLSEKGWAEATYGIGVYYYNVLGDVEKGISYIKQAAKEGCQHAAVLLSQIYEQGVGPIMQDINQSFKYLKRAAELNDPVSQFKYGILIGNGTLGSDTIEGTKWIQKAAENGLPFAQYQIGMCYIDNHEDDSLPHDFPTGVKWLRSAAAQGVEDAVKLLDSLGLTEELSHNDRAVAFYNALNSGNEELGRTATDKMVLCCQYGDPCAEWIIGLLYYHGIFADENKEEGMRLLNLSAEQNFVEAIEAIAMLLIERGRYNESFPYLVRAVELGSHSAICNLGSAYYNGHGVEKDVVKAFQLWEKAAEFGNTDAMNALGNCYTNGILVQQDINKGIAFYTNSANLGDTRAMEILIELYDALGASKEKLYWESILKQYNNGGKEN